jgi:hypothetical protein
MWMIESAVARSQVRDQQKDRNKSKGKTSILRCRSSLTTTLLPRRRYSLKRSTEFEVRIELSAAFPLISKSLFTAQSFLVTEEARATRELAQPEAASSQALSLGGEFWHCQSCLQLGFLKNVSSLGCSRTGGEAGAQTVAVAARGPRWRVPAPPQLGHPRAGCARALPRRRAPPPGAVRGRGASRPALSATSEDEDAIGVARFQRGGGGPLREGWQK